MNGEITKLFDLWFAKNERTLCEIKSKLGERSALERAFFDGYEAAILAARFQPLVDCRQPSRTTVMENAHLHQPASPHN
jgi:hypothetical protein